MLLLLLLAFILIMTEKKVIHVLTSRRLKQLHFHCFHYMQTTTDGVLGVESVMNKTIIKRFKRANSLMTLFVTCKLPCCKFQEILLQRLRNTLDQINEMGKWNMNAGRNTSFITVTTELYLATRNQFPFLYILWI